MEVIVNIKFKDKEIKEILKSMVIIVDSREQENSHILNYFDKKKILYKVSKLNYGDYSVMVPKNNEFGIDRDIYLDNQIVIERKNSLDELANNFSKGRERFQNEFLRAKGANILLMIENAKYSDLINHNYRSLFSEKAFLASLKSFEAKYNISTNFIDDDSLSGNFIYYSLYYKVRQVLIGGA